MNDFEAIYARHSVRSYKPDAIEADKVLQLREKIDELNAAGNLHLQFIEDAGRTYSRLMNRVAGLGSAPSVIACVGKDAEDLDQRVGYYGEQLVLFAQKLGLNTCWTGTFSKGNTDADVKEGERLVICIAIGYGQDQGRVRKSKSYEDVAKVDAAVGEAPEWFKKGVEMALLAPTAINQQKFVIRLGADESVELVDKGGIFSKVDLGIVKCHFEIGAGREVTKS
ncbi:nitroreductase [Butyrivibrio sp. CB08]|uniref:nitroreductase family protein n=1 Tax=Butyrivibrio sp. CB08 TaxID=2364879 RepID=UPI000EAAA1F5|nr:nitroreductase family protein [Butyrivibrio sp. CB08]RKM60371.1 nitroreductase [Butyrivibrio sp. CB08]